MALKFYSDNILQNINDNLDSIEEAATRAGYTIMEPDNNEYNNIKQLIVEYIKKQKRIVYGGSAYHSIIQKYRHDKKADSRIYKDW